MIPRPSSVHGSHYSNGTGDKRSTLNKLTNGAAFEEPKTSNPCVRFRNAIEQGMDTFFYRYGSLVARKPGWFILLSFVLTGICGAGFSRFRTENNGSKLWIPSDSSQRVNTDWLWENYPPDLRFASLVLVADDVLTPQVIQAMYKHKKDIEAIVTKEFNMTWDKICVKIPVLRPPDPSVIFGKRRRKRQANSTDEFDFKFDDNFIEDSNFFEDYNDDFFNNYDGETSDDNEHEFETKKATKTEAEKQTDTAESFSRSKFFYPDKYCKIIESMEEACMAFSILELWANDGKYDKATDDDIAALTKEQILDKVNNVNKSGVFLLEKDFTKLLSNIKRDESGKIVAAEAAVMQWFSRLNTTAAMMNPDKSRGEPIDTATLEFEEDMVKVLLKKESYPDRLESYPNVQRSFGDIAGSTILGDVASLAIGYFVLTIYVQIMLGRLNCVENRALLAIAGIIGVVLGIGVSYGFCSLVGLFFGPLHNILPFLLLGIGVDDMFVIVQCWDTMERKRGVDDDTPLHERFGKTMMEAGSAIFITSATDIIAFAIGGFTVLPALQSFCLFASVGIVAIFFFQCTFFVAWMSIDQRRSESQRNACLPCYRHTDYSPSSFSRKDFTRAAFNYYSRALMHPVAKAVVALVTLAITAVAIWGNILLEQRFDPAWFLPPETYLSKWFEVSKKYFPAGGERVTVYMANTDPRLELPNIIDLTKKFEEADDVIDTVNSWAPKFVNYYNLEAPKTKKLPGYVLPEKEFAEMLTQFLFSPRGAEYRGRFKFDGDLKCGKASPKLLMSDIQLQHRFFKGPEEHIPAMNKVKQFVKEANLTGKVFPMARAYAVWETDEVISFELYRNIGLAILCVFITTLFLISNVITSLIVLFCVVMSLVDVGGYMHFWGLTIDTVSCVNLIIAIGLCVDYSAHIAHRFMLEQRRSKNKRVIEALTNIGPAVLNGGISTFLAFILLAGSKSHVFSSFFKIFFLVVTFGLFQGLVVLPVILSLFGPKSENNETEPVMLASNEKLNSEKKSQPIQQSPKIPPNKSRLAQ